MDVFPQVFCSPTDARPGLYAPLDMSRVFPCQSLSRLGCGFCSLASLVVRKNQKKYREPWSRKAMKPICGKGNQKTRTASTPDQPNPWKSPSTTHLICISWTATEDHVMAAALVESVERLWFSDFFHEGKINAGHWILLSFQTLHSSKLTWLAGKWTIWRCIS